MLLCSYHTAYANFRRDHADPCNLAVHTLALVGQVTANFALLHELDRTLGPVGGVGSVVSRTTVAGWAGMLAIQTDAPVVVRAVAVTGIAAAHVHRAECGALWCGVVSSTVAAVVEGVILHVALRKQTLAEWKTLLAIRVGVQVAVAAYPGALAECRAPVATAAVATVVGLALFGKPTDWSRLNVFHFGLIAGPVAVLTGNPSLYFWGLAYQASMFQGVGHVLCREPATLPQLRENVAYEYGHTTYFPALVLSSVFESLRSPRA
eukprot:CAMPEP_0206293032 /NCGR_PEP_ID=MMETSP0106_2-20121207/3932_1 /ASSEMBLY_ACC=CAM_ASM_000206 /TAXON_ID=81532 /ORGANISM="Acanthoeca-like sp., Strain 10tr" /LENGTH=263 /DNA_ID=CAMNT_0053723623 /DNA_START=166 /DNA_END=953 /DNA_ORIENTATION=+